MSLATKLGTIPDFRGVAVSAQDNAHHYVPEGRLLMPSIGMQLAATNPSNGDADNGITSVLNLGPWFPLDPDVVRPVDNDGVHLHVGRHLGVGLITIAVCELVTISMGPSSTLARYLFSFDMDGHGAGVRGPSGAGATGRPG